MPKELDRYSNGMYIEFNIGWRDCSIEEQKAIIKFFSFPYNRAFNLVRLWRESLERDELVKKIEELESAIKAREDLYSAAQLVIETTELLESRGEEA